MNIKDVFRDAIPLVEKFAPTIGAAIGGPIGAAAGAVIPILANVFDGHPNDIPGLVQRILTDSDASNKLQSLENEHHDWLCSMMDTVQSLVKAEISIKLEWQPSESK